MQQTSSWGYDAASRESGLLRPIEIHCDGGRIFVGSPLLVPSYPRSSFAAVSALHRLIRDNNAVAQLRQAWPKLNLGSDHHHSLSVADLRELMERAIAQRRVNLLWVPPMAHAPLVITVPLQRPQVSIVPPSPSAQPTPPPFSRPISTLDTSEKFETALEQALGYIVKDAKAETLALRKAIQNLTPTQKALIISSFALFLVPGAGEIMLAYVSFRLGFDGARAAIHLIHGCYAVATARNQPELDKAARELADGIENLGETLLDWLMRGQLMKAVAPAAKGATETEAAVKASDEAINTKISKPEVQPSYKSYLSKKAPVVTAVANAENRVINTAKLSDLEAQYLSRYQALYNEGAADVRAKIDSGRLVIPEGIHENTFIGQRIDIYARDGMKEFAEEMGHGEDIIKINKRLYLPDGSYRVPDIFFPQSGTIFDETIGTKTVINPQIVDFGVANGNAPIYIVRPDSYGGTYMIGH